MPAPINYETNMQRHVFCPCQNGAYFVFKGFLKLKYSHQSPGRVLELSRACTDQESWGNINRKLKQKIFTCTVSIQENRKKHEKYQYQYKINGTILVHQ